MRHTNRDLRNRKRKQKIHNAMKKKTKQAKRSARAASRQPAGN